MVILAIVGPLHFHRKFSLSRSLLGFDGDCTDSIDQLKRTEILTISSLLTHEHSISLNLLGSLIYISNTLHFSLQRSFTSFVRFIPKQFINDYNGILLLAFFLFFLGLHLWHMEIPRLGAELPAYTTATAMRDWSRICNVHHSSQQR